MNRDGSGGRSFARIAPPTIQNRTKIRIALAVAWAAPWSLVGLLAGFVALATGGRASRSGRVLEFYGGFLPWILKRVPIDGGASAMTLGHVVVSCDREQLARCRHHERVHVRQYERWGVLFVPAYLACSVALWFRGLDPYRDNPFEVEAARESQNS
jgi:hypothetical protein